MNEQDYKDLISHELLTAINKLCPTGKEQKGFVRMLHEMQRNLVPGKEQAIQLVGALWDGLAYGNWPGEGEQP